MANDSLNPKQMDFVRHYTSGKSAAEAAPPSPRRTTPGAQRSSYSEARPSAARLNALRGAVREAADYDLNEAVKEIDSLISFAREKGNPMAAVKGAEVKLRLFGMLTDKLRVEQTTIDLTETLAEARSRAFSPDVIAGVAKRVEE